MRVQKAPCDFSEKNMGQMNSFDDAALRSNKDKSCASDGCTAFALKCYATIGEWGRIQRRLP